MTLQGDAALYSELMEECPNDYAEALAGAGVGLFVVDWIEASKHLNYNSVMREALGLSQDELVSRDEGFDRIVHPEDAKAMRETTDKNFAEGRSFSFRHRLLRSSGSYFPCHIHIKPIIGRDGSVDKAIGVIRDQDDLERALDRMDRAERMAALGNWHVDLRTCKLTWSRGTFAIYGFEPSDMEPTVVSIPVQKGATRRSKTGPLLECKCRALARVLPT